MRSILKITLFLLIIIFSTDCFAGDVYVNGYTRKNGTYVQGHYRSAPDSNPYNNYSTIGNTNPYTGNAGTVDPNKNNNNNYNSYTKPQPTYDSDRYGKSGVRY